MDFIGAILELAGKWVTGRKNRYGWLISTTASLCWILYVVISKVSYGMLIIAIPAIVINLWNFRKWSKFRD